MPGPLRKEITLARDPERLAVGPSDADPARLARNLILFARRSQSICRNAKTLCVPIAAARARGLYREKSTLIPVMRIDALYTTYPASLRRGPQTRKRKSTLTSVLLGAAAGVGHRRQAANGKGLASGAAGLRGVVDAGGVLVGVAVEADACQAPEGS